LAGKTSVGREPDAAEVVFVEVVGATDEDNVEAPRQSDNGTHV